MSNKLTNLLLIALHAAVASVVISAVWSTYSDRQAEHQRIEDNAQAARAKADSRAEEVNIKKELLKGLQEDDAYVIEKIARDNYDYVGDNELSPAGD